MAYSNPALGLGTGAIAGLQMFRQNERQDAMDARQQGLYDRQVEAYEQKKADAEFERPILRRAMERKDKAAEREEEDNIEMRGARDALAQIQTTGNYGAVNDYMHSLGHDDFLLLPTDHRGVFEMQYDGKSDTVTQAQTTMFLMSKAFPEQYAKSMLNEKDHYEPATVLGIKGQRNTATGEFKPFPKNSVSGSGTAPNEERMFLFYQRMFPKETRAQIFARVKQKVNDPAQLRADAIKAISNDPNYVGLDPEEKRDAAEELYNWMTRDAVTAPIDDRPNDGQIYGDQAPTLGLSSVGLPPGGGVLKQQNTGQPVTITSAEQFQQLNTGDRFIYQGQLRIKN